MCARSGDWILDLVGEYRWKKTKEDKLEMFKTEPGSVLNIKIHENGGVS